MKKLLKILGLWFIIGCVYYFLEGVWHIPSGGWANIAMMPIGGLCGVLIGALNQKPAFYNKTVLCQCVISTCIVVAIEFLSGLILNVWLGLDVWDYSDKPLNLLGQICLPYSMLWFILSPTAIWLEDALRYKLYGEGEYYCLLSIYKELLTDLK